VPAAAFVDAADRCGGGRFDIVDLAGQERSPRRRTQLAESETTPMDLISAAALILANPTYRAA
jgi:hypothetical protein